MRDYFCTLLEKNIYICTIRVVTGAAHSKVQWLYIEYLFVPLWFVPDLAP